MYITDVTMTPSNVIWVDYIIDQIIGWNCCEQFQAALEYLGGDIPVLLW
jgi:hypothetical protein